MAEETHTDFEIAIERELHGALDEVEARTLADHLLDCPSCRAYQKSAVEVETNMEAIARLESPTLVLENVTQNVNKRLRKARTDAYLAIGSSLVIAAMTLLIRPRHQALIERLPLFAINAIVCVFLILQAIRSRRALVQRATLAEGNADALFALIERETLKRDAAVKRSFILSFLLVPFLGVAFFVTFSILGFARLSPLLIVLGLVASVMPTVATGLMYLRNRRA